MLWHQGCDLRTQPLSARRTILENLPTSPAVGRVDTYPGGAADVWAFAREHQLEGVVVKRADSRYRSGRSTAWQKFKLRHRQLVWVTAWRPGGPAEPDRYRVSRHDPGGALSPAGEVGFGLHPGQAAALRPILYPASLGPRRRNGLIPVAPVLAMTVESHGPPAGWLRDPIITGVHLLPSGPDPEDRER